MPELGIWTDLLAQSPIVAALVWVVLGLRKDRNRDIERFEEMQDRSTMALDGVKGALGNVNVTMASVKTVVERLNGGGR